MEKNPDRTNNQTICMQNTSFMSSGDIDQATSQVIFVSLIYGRGTLVTQEALQFRPLALVRSCLGLFSFRTHVSFTCVKKSEHSTKFKTGSVRLQQVSFDYVWFVRLGRPYVSYRLDVLNMGESVRITSHSCFFFYISYYSCYYSGVCFFLFHTCCSHAPGILYIVHARWSVVFSSFCISLERWVKNALN